MPKKTEASTRRSSDAPQTVSFRLREFPGILHEIFIKGEIGFLCKGKEAGSWKKEEVLLYNLHVVPINEKLKKVKIFPELPGKSVQQQKQRKNHWSAWVGL